MRLFNMKQLALLMVLMILTVSTAAASTTSLSTARYAGGNGGHISSGNGKYTLNGTFGQSNSTVRQGADRFTLVSGFWGSGQEKVESGTVTFLPVVQQ